MADSPPVRVVGYIRVSTEEQAGSGQSLEAQSNKLTLFCRLHDLDLVRIVEDPGISAKSLDRPNLLEAFRMIDAGEVAGLVVAKLDRLTRNVADLAEVLKHFEEGRGQLFSVADSIDTRTAAGRMVANILVTIAQWERETIVERTQEVMSLKRSKGERLGEIPLGWRLGPDGRTLVPDPTELAAIGIIRQLAGAGYSLRGIATELDRIGIRTKKGKEKWAFSTVRKYRDAG